MKELKMTKWQQRLTNAFIIFLIIGAILLVYLHTGIMTATDEARDYLNSTEEVTVIKIDEGYFFDGPGEETAIVFFPGGKVECEVYAQLMYKIARDGRDCFLLEVPYNLAIFGKKKAEKIFENYNYTNWYMSGHSLGGVAACAFTANRPDMIKGVIVLAAYPPNPLPIDSKSISIYGSNDEVLDRENYKEARKEFSPQLEEFIIEGGNHS